MSPTVQGVATTLSLLVLAASAIRASIPEHEGVMSFGVAVESAVTSAAPSPPCTQCNARRWPPSVCCVSGTFCCGYRTCCANGQACTVDDVCINVTSAPPVPPGPQAAGQLEWAAFTDYLVSQPLVSSKDNVIAVGGIKMAGYTLSDGTPQWTSSVQLQPGTTPQLASALSDGSSVIVTVDQFYNVIALEPRTGAIRWTYTSPSQTTYFACSLLIGQGDVLLVTGSDSIVGISLLDGTVKWTVSTSVAQNCAPTPATESHFIILDVNGTLKALDTTTGHVDWQVRNIMVSEASDVMYTEGIVVINQPVEADGTFTAYLSSTGAVLWNYNYTINGATPKVFAGHLFWTSTGFSNMHIHVISCRTGVVQWRWLVTYLDGYYPSVRGAFVPEGQPSSRLVMLVNDDVSLIAVQQGKILWNDTGVTATTPILHSSGKLFLGAESSVVAIDARSGSRLWTHATQAVVTSPVTLSADADGLPRLFVGATDYFLYAFKP